MPKRPAPLGNLDSNNLNKLITSLFRDGSGTGMTSFGDIKVLVFDGNLLAEAG